MIRSYRAFASVIYRRVICIAYPIVAIICCILVQNGCFGLLNDQGYSYMITLSLLSSCMIAVETIGDYWFLSGIQSKDVNRMDFMKGSKKGKTIILNAVKADLYRRGTTIFFCNAANVLIGIFVFKHKSNGFDGLLEILLGILSCYALSTLAVFISRFKDQWIMNLSMAYIVSFMSQIFMFLRFKTGTSALLWILFYLVLGIIGTIITVKIIKKKMEDSYYDERS